MFTEIEKLEELKGVVSGLSDEIFSVYEYDEDELQELLCRFFMKINECVGVSNKALEIMKWVEQQGLPQEVNKIFEKWLTDGTFDNIINEKLFTNLLELINSKTRVEVTENYPSEIVRENIYFLSGLALNSSTGNSEKELKIMINGVNYNPRSKTTCIRDDEGETQETKNNNFKLDIANLKKSQETQDTEIANLKKSQQTQDTNISNLQDKDEEIQRTIEEMNNKLFILKVDKVYYLDEYKGTDFSLAIKEALANGKEVIIASSGKEYNFNTTITVNKRLNIYGNHATFRWLGTGRMFQFINAPWLIEGCTMENFFVWGRGQDVGSDVFVYAESSGGHGHVGMSFRNLIIYNFPICFRFHTQSYGHHIEDCSMWGFKTAINSTGNAEQISVIHCWLDDGLRGVNTQNPVIRVEDATSFWIERCVIQNADIGVSFRGVRNGTIRDCHFENMISHSIWFYPASQYENRNCVVDCNYLVGGKGAVYFLVGTQKNAHNTFTNNYIAFLGDGANYAFHGSQLQACEYSLYYNNSLAPEFTNRQLLAEGVTHNKITAFQ